MSEFNQSKYINNFKKEKYDTFKVEVPKGHKATIKAHSEQKGYKSLNSYINALINLDMAGETAGGGNLEASSQSDAGREAPEGN